MRVRFTATIDDLADVHIRILKRNRTAGALWKGMALVAVIGGVITALAAREDPGRFVAVGIGAALGAGLYFAVQFVAYQWPSKSSYRRELEQQVGTDQPFDVVVELTPDGVTATQMGFQVTHSWTIVADIEEDADAIIFHMRHGDILAVRGRAFESPRVRQEFLALAHERRSAASAGKT